MAQQSFKRLTVLGSCRQSAATSSGDGHRQRCVSTEHVLQLGGLVDDLVKGHADEVHEHQVNDGAQASNGCANTKTNNGLFADGRVNNTLLTKLCLQTSEGSEDSTKCTDVFARAEYVGVGFHHLRYGFIESLRVCEFAIVTHQFAPVMLVYTLTMIWSGVG